MSMPSGSEESPDLQWDSFTHLYDDHTGNIDVSSLNWTLNSAERNKEAVQYSSSAANYTATLGKKLESSDCPAEKTAQHDLDPKVRRTKGRAKHSRERGDQTAVEVRIPWPNTWISKTNLGTQRRRNQVRLAQQAYRHRKEEHAKSLRREIDDLKQRLIGMERVFEDLFSIVSLSDLPDKLKGTVENLHVDAQRYRLSPETRDAAEVALLKAGQSDKNASDSLPPQSSGDILDISSDSYLSEVHLEGSQTPIQIIPPNITTYRPPYASSFLPNTSDIELHIKHLGGIPKTAMTLPLWLRYESLKGAYIMVTNQETPYALLCRTFRYCVFTSTREQIMKNVRGLIHETLVQAHQAPSTPITINKDTLSSGTYSVSPTDQSSTATFKSELNQPYMSPEGVDKYLSERGLKVDPSSSYVTFKLTQSSVSTTTLFEEICQRKELRISVRRLLNGENQLYIVRTPLKSGQLMMTLELQTRMVCLVVGPGILVSEIDDAIRSTVLAGI